MFSPTPRKACTAFGSPRPFWHDAQAVISPASQERETLLPDWTLAFEGASEVSTSAGPSPSLVDAPSPLLCHPLSPSLMRPITPSDEGGKLEVHTTPELAQKRRGSVEKGMGQQTRKIFVGGVPQSIDQNGLYKMFNKVGKVKKAWLQMFHADRPEGACNKHRGFGFVIFAEEAAVEDLLGGDSSKVIYFGDGLRLEVKCAIGRMNTCSKFSDMNEGAVKAYAQVSSEQSMPNLSLERVLTPLPSVPPFPVMQATQVHWQYCNIGTVSMLSSQALPPSTSNHPDWLDQFLPNILRDAFVGRMPQNKKELEWLLRHAMPDRYEE